MSVERRFALRKLRAGDWLLPSNDGKTLYRLIAVTEGPSSGIDAWRRDRTVWEVWRWPRPLPVRDVRTDSMDGWQEVEIMLRTRREAIARALRGGAR